MNEIAVYISDDILEALKEPPETPGATLRMVAAAKLYEIGRLSTGAAAQLAGVLRPDWPTTASTPSISLTRL